MTKTLEIEDNEGRFERFQCTPDEAQGALKYMKRHASLPGAVVTRIYLYSWRKGLDLNAIPLAEGGAK